MATSRRVGNYATSANAVIRNSDAIFDAAMSGKPDFTKISKEAIKGRSLERRAVTKAEGDVAVAGIKAFDVANRTKIKADTQKEIRDIMRPAKRMAGVVAGLGAISGAALMHKNAKEDKAERDALRAEQQAVWDLQTSMMDDMRAQSKALRDQIAAFNDQPFSGAVTPPKNSGSEPTNSGSSPVQTKPISSASLPSGGPVNAKSIANMAAASGAKYPKLVAAQWALESGWGKTPSGKNNFFGIKAGAGEQGTSKQTWEVYGGKEVNTSARFKDFDSPQDSVNELVSRWHKDYKNYRGVNNASDAFSAADMLTTEGYATDPNYAKKLKDIMSGFDF